jgi:hypothetical protein
LQLPLLQRQLPTMELKITTPTKQRLWILPPHDIQQKIKGQSGPRYDTVVVIRSSQLLTLHQRWRWIGNTVGSITYSPPAIMTGDYYGLSPLLILSSAAIHPPFL